MVLKQFDIILQHTDNLITSKLIRGVTKDVYNHSMLYLGGNHILDARWPQGVKIRELDNRLEEFDVYRYNSKFTEKQKELIEEFIQKNINRKYDLLELFGQLFNKNIGSSKKYICISLVLEAFRYAGINVGETKLGFRNITDNKIFKKI